MKGVDTEPRWHDRFRSALLLTTGVLVGMLLVSPAVGHVTEGATHLWERHIKPRADARYVGSQQVLWAFVDESANLVRGRGAIAAERGAETGQYVVTFDRDVSSCAWVATRATALDSAGEIATAAGPEPDMVVVDIHTPTAIEGDDAPFSLAVFC